MATSYLTKVFGSDSNLDKWTLSMWVKRGNVDSTVAIYGTYINGSNYELITFTSGGVLYWENYQSSSMKSKLETKRLFRDPAAWYHLVFVWDSANASAGDRARIYVNGVEETEWETDTQPSSGQDSLIGNTYTQQIGANGSGNNDYEGCMSHIHFCDGYAYAASDFGETDATSGIWKIKTSPSVSYGTNGYFILKDGAVVTDSSPNSNNWTIYEYITATKDNPSNNFATLNPLENYYPASTFSYGNNRIATSSSPYSWNMSTLGVSAGKWYFEAYVQSAASTSEQIFGISPGSPIQNNKDVGGVLNGYGYYGSGSVRSNGSAVITGMPTYTTGDYVGCAFDLDNNKIYFHDNGTYINSGDPSAGTGGYAIVAADSQTFSNKSNAYFPSVGDYDSSGAATWDVNFGNGYFGTTLIGSPDADDGGVGAFKYTVPTGFRALCTKNIKAYGG